MRRAVLACGLATGLAGPTPAQASDFGGMLSGLLTFTIAMPLAVLSLVLVAVLARAGAYRSRRLALWHAGLAALPPLAGAVAILLEGRVLDDAGVRLLAAGIMLALALLPVLMHVRQAAIAATVSTGTQAQSP